MSKPAPSSISASRLAASLAGLAALLVAADQGGGALLGAAWPHSTANPIAAPIRAEAQTLVLGSSTAKRAFDPAALGPGSYNAAEDGQGLFFVAAYMRNLPSRVPYGRVFLGLDPDEFAAGLASPNTRNLKRMAPFAARDRQLFSEIAIHDRDLETKFHSGLYPFRGAVVSTLWRWAFPKTDGDGYAPLPGRLAAYPAWRPDAKPPAAMAYPAEAAFADILSQAAQREIQLVLVVTPLAGGHRRERDPLYAPIMAAIRKLAAGAACDLTAKESPEIDALAADPALFHDGAHLNAEGARRYSRLVADLAARHCPPAPAR
jgi:hypothetical protein